MQSYQMLMFFAKEISIFFGDLLLETSDKVISGSCLFQSKRVGGNFNTCNIYFLHDTPI